MSFKKKEKKDNLPPKYIELALYVKDLNQCFAPMPQEHKLQINTSANCIHHLTQWNDTDGKTYQQFVKAPIFNSSSIICTTDDKTGKQSFCLFVDIYRNWPKTDADGDLMKAALEGTHARYNELLDSAPLLEIKKKIFARTKQYDTVEMPDANQAMVEISTRLRTKSPIVYPVYDEKHERAGQRDPSKSPIFILKLWEKELDEDDAVPETALLVNNRRQVIYTKIYDRTVNFHVEACATEKDLANVIYYKGSAKQGKQMFSLEVQPVIMAMTEYFPKEKKADSQFKCSLLNITKKKVSSFSQGMTAEDEESLKRLMLRREEESEATNEKRATYNDHGAEADDADKPPQKKVRLGDDV